MQDWIGLLIAFVLGFFMKSLMGTMCQSHLIEANRVDTDYPNEKAKANNMELMINKISDYGATCVALDPVYAQICPKRLSSKKQIKERLQNVWALDIANAHNDPQKLSNLVCTNSHEKSGTTCRLDLPS